MSAGSRRKGVRGEREVAGILQSAVAAHGLDARFVRTPASGGWHGPAVRREFRAGGDLMCTVEFPWSVEVKWRDCWAYEVWWRGSRSSPVWRWWEQSKVAADESGLLPMLWVKKSRRRWSVVVSGRPGFDWRGLSGAMSAARTPAEAVMVLLGARISYSEWMEAPDGEPIFAARVV